MDNRANAPDQCPGVQAHEDATSLPFDELITRLRDILGVRLVGYIGRVQLAHIVSNWVSGEAVPGENDQQRLRHAYHAAALLQERYDTVTVQAWFKGMNPALRYEAPAKVLREGEPLDAARQVLAAARSFACIG